MGERDGEVQGKGGWETWMGRFLGEVDGERCLGRFLAEPDACQGALTPPGAEAKLSPQVLRGLQWMCQPSPALSFPFPSLPAVWGVIKERA